MEKMMTPYEKFVEHLISSEEHLQVAGKGNYIVIKKFSEPSRCMEIFVEHDKYSVEGIMHLTLRVFKDPETPLMRDVFLSEKNLTVNGTCFLWESLPSFSRVVEELLRD